jgi:hypothetical protein
MNAIWSRWLLGAWAVLTVVWLVGAVLILVHAWPEPSVSGDQEQFFRSTANDVALSAQPGSRLAPAEREHIKRFVLLAILPPGFLFALVWFSLWVAGLPFPSLRRRLRD